MVDQPLFPGLDKNAAPMNGNGNSPSAVASKPALPDLFGEPSTPKGPSTEGSTVVNAVVSQTDAGNVRILGPKPSLNPNIELPGSTFSVGRLLFRLSALLAMATFLFFYSQLQTRFDVFGKNPAQKLAGLESNIQEEQTTLNLYHWTLAKYALDDFSVLADHYLYQLAVYDSEWTSRNEKAELQVELADLQESMKNSLATAQSNIAHSLYPENFEFSELSIPQLEEEYTSLFLNRIEADKQTLLSKEGGPYTTDIGTLESVANLFNHTDFRNQLRSLDLTSDLSKAEIQTLFEYSMEVSTSEYLTVLTIKNQREDWSNLLQSIDSLTGRVDPLYESNLPSYVEYSNIGFDIDTGAVTLRGETRTDDSLNFSVISDLIDELEASPLFMDVDTRSFSKTESKDEGYTAQFTLSMTLQEGEDSRDKVTTTPTPSGTTDPVSTEEEAPIEESTTSSADSTETESSSMTDLTETLETVTDVVAETGGALIQVMGEYIDLNEARGEFINTLIHLDVESTPTSRIPRTPQP